MMVSTRGVKFKFCEGEKVLCYEPDLTKAKVLYDSKVLEVNDLKKDSRGRKSVEYLIHFQGWNSSWDRYVCEDYVLKDIDENRQLQRDLAEKAQLQLGAYLYRRERTKRRRKPFEIPTDDLEEKRLRVQGDILDGDEAISSDDGSSCSPSHHDGNENSGDEVPVSPRAESSDRDLVVNEGEEEDDNEEDDDDDKVPLELSDTMKRLLELDHDLIKNKNKLVRLPAEPNVIAILEGYLKYYAVNVLCGPSVDKTQCRFRPPQAIPNMLPHDMEEARRLLNICKEMVDGVRIYFDFTLKGLLLYNPECEQYETHRNMPPKLLVKQEQIEDYTNEMSHNIKQELDEDTCTSQCEENGQGSNSLIPHVGNGEEDSSDCNRKRRLRSYRSDPSEGNTYVVNGFVKTPQVMQRDEDPEDNFPLAHYKQELTSNNFQVSNSTMTSTSSRCSSPNGHGPNSTTNQHSNLTGTTQPKSNTLLNQILAWQLVPDSMYNEVPAKPSLVYGAIHLARLFVKLPKLLYETNMPEKKLKVLLRELDVFVHYLEEHSEWFGESFYKDNDTSSV